MFDYERIERHYDRQDAKRRAAVHRAIADRRAARAVKTAKTANV